VLSCHVRSDKELGDGIVDTGLHTIGSGATAATSAETGEKHYEGVSTACVLQLAGVHSCSTLQPNTVTTATVGFAQLSSMQERTC
jgi:hypothetical protein